MRSTAAWLALVAVLPWCLQTLGSTGGLANHVAQSRRALKKVPSSEAHSHARRLYAAAAEPELCEGDEKPDPSTADLAGLVGSVVGGQNDGKVHRVMVRFKLEADPVLKAVGAALAKMKDGPAATPAAPAGLAMEDVGPYLAGKMANGWLRMEEFRAWVVGIPVLEQVVDRIDHVYYGVHSRLLILDLKNNALAQLVLTIVAGSDLVETCSLDTVVRAQPARRDASAAAVNDPLFPIQWALPTVGAVGEDDTGVPAAWEVTNGDKGIVVAVIDTGVDYKHPDLVDNMWKNAGEIPGNGIDDDGNGFIDDYDGWNFVSGTQDPMDDHHHGTHCAGIIAAKGNNGEGIAGIAPGVTILPVKVLDVNGSGYTSDIIMGFEYALNMSAHIISASLGGPGPVKEYDVMLKAAESFGVLVVAAAGNERANNDVTISYPCNSPVPIVLSVASSMYLGCLSGFSNYGKTTVHIVAPGSDIMSTVPTSFNETGYAFLSGTSMATPLVAGAAALVLSYMKASGFEYVAQGVVVKELLLKSVKKDPRYTEFVTTGGQLDIRNALAMAKKVAAGTQDSRGRNDVAAANDRYSNFDRQNSFDRQNRFDQQNSFDRQDSYNPQDNFNRQDDSHIHEGTDRRGDQFRGDSSHWERIASYSHSSRQYTQEQYQPCGQGLCCKQYNWNGEPLYCLYQNKYYSQCGTLSECGRSTGYNCNPSQGQCGW